MNSASCSWHEPLHGLQELGAHVVVAALALDRLGDEAGDVVRVRARTRARACASARSLGRLDLAEVSPAGSDAGTSMRGQPNLGKRSVLTGSVLVSDRV